MENETKKIPFLTVGLHLIICWKKPDFTQFKILKVVLLVLVCNCSFGQDTTLYLHGWKKPRKVIEVGTYCNIKVELKKNDSAGKIYPTFYEGRIVSVWPDKIIIRINHEKLEKITEDGMVLESSNVYVYEKDHLTKIYREFLNKKKNSAGTDSLEDLTPANIRTVYFNSISSISFPKQSGFLNMSAVMAEFCAVGLVGALIAAPIQSIDFATGDFNQKTYYSSLLVYGTVFVIGIPITMFCNKEKHCKIRMNAGPHDGNYYCIRATRENNSP